MRRKVKIKITTASERTIQLPVVALCARCPDCKREVELFTREQAMVILQIRERALDGVIADGLVHTVHTVIGNQWVCKDSLFAI